MVTHSVGSGQKPQRQVSHDRAEMKPSITVQFPAYFVKVVNFLALILSKFKAKN